MTDYHIVLQTPVILHSEIPTLAKMLNRTEKELQILANFRGGLMLENANEKHPYGSIQEQYLLDEYRTLHSQTDVEVDLYGADALRWLGQQAGVDVEFALLHEVHIPGDVMYRCRGRQREDIRWHIRRLANRNERVIRLKSLDKAIPQIIMMCEYRMISDAVELLIDSNIFGGLRDTDGYQIRSLSDIGFNLLTGEMDDEGKLLYSKKNREEN